MRPPVVDIVKDNPVQGGLLRDTSVVSIRKFHNALVPRALRMGDVEAVGGGESVHPNLN